MIEKYKVCFTKTTEKPTGDNSVYGIVNDYYQVSRRGNILLSEGIDYISLIEQIIKTCRSPKKVSLELTIK